MLVNINIRAASLNNIVYIAPPPYAFARHLDGTVLQEYPRPTVLITDAYNASVEQAKRKTRDTALIGL